MQKASCTKTETALGIFILKTETTWAALEEQQAMAWLEFGLAGLQLKHLCDTKLKNPSKF